MPALSSAVSLPGPVRADGPASGPRHPPLCLTRLRIAVTPLLAHFITPGYVPEPILSRHENTLNDLLRETKRDGAIREELGEAPEFWEDMTALANQAANSLTKRCLLGPDAATDLDPAPLAPYDDSVLQDLQRVNASVALARNVCVAGKGAQNLAFLYAFENEVCSLIALSLRIGIKGYEGQPETSDQDKWPPLCIRCINAQASHHTASLTDFQSKSYSSRVCNS